MLVCFMHRSTQTNYHKQIYYSICLQTSLYTSSSSYLVHLENLQSLFQVIRTMNLQNKHVRFQYKLFQISIIRQQNIILTTLQVIFSAFLQQTFNKFKSVNHNKDINIFLQQMRTIIRRFCTVKLNHLTYDNKKQWDLIVLHGLLGSHKNFRTLMKNQQISSRANVHMLDNRNHGDSPHTEHHTYQLMAKDLKQFIDEKKLKKVIILGHSMGGGVVYTFSDIFPQMQNNVKQLIILDMPLKLSEKKSNEAIINGLANIDLSQPKQKIMRDVQTIGQNKVISDFLKTNLRERQGKMQWVSNILTLKHNYPKIVQQILRKPTKWINNVDIMYGDRSPSCSKYQCLRLKQFYKNFSEDNIHEIQNAGHWLHFDNPKKFMETLGQILQKNID